MRRNSFTEAEVEEIVASVKENPTNLQKVFRELSEKWGRHSPQSISRYYYANLKNSRTLFITVCDRRGIANTKISRDGTLGGMRAGASLLRKIKRLLGMN